MRSSGMDGQAVSEGVMIRYKNKAALSVRKPDGKIRTKKAGCHDLKKVKAFRIPVIRGIIYLVDSLVTGFKAFNYSDVIVYEDSDDKDINKKKTGRKENEKSGENNKKESAGGLLRNIIEVILAVIIAVALFLVLPVLVSDIIKRSVSSENVLIFLEELTRIIFFLIFILVISLNKEIRKIFKYNGAVNMTLNCVEEKLDPVPANIKKMSHKRAGCNMGFLFTVIFVSIILFCFIKISQPAVRIAVRVLVIPAVSGIVYELMIFAGNSEKRIARLLYKPAMWFQSFVVRVPDEEMIEVSAACMKAVFDWKKFYKNAGQDSVISLPDDHNDSGNDHSAEEKNKKKNEKEKAGKTTKSGETVKADKTVENRNTVKSGKAIKAERTTEGGNSIKVSEKRSGDKKYKPENKKSKDKRLEENKRLENKREENKHGEGKYDENKRVKKIRKESSREEKINEEINTADENSERKSGPDSRQRSSRKRRRRSNSHDIEERNRIREAHKEEIRKNRLEREQLIKESEEAEREFNEILAEVDRHEKEKAGKVSSDNENDELKNLDVYLFEDSNDDKEQNSEQTDE